VEVRDGRYRHCCNQHFVIFGLYPGFTRRDTFNSALGGLTMIDHETRARIRKHIVKMTPEWMREQREYDKRELAAALLARHQARKARRARAKDSSWMKFAASLYGEEAGL
jgi:hypothetical protein